MKYKRLVIILLVAVLAFTIGSIYGNLQDEPAKTQATITLPHRDPATPEELLNYINAERAKVGIAPLVIDPQLNQSAQLKADDMATNNYFGHVNPTTGKHGYSYINDLNIRCVEQSENLNKTADELLPARINVEYWMSSPTHKAAILDARYNTTGFGVEQGYVVEHFCDI
jgi:uncharacterized protein YkwD